MDLWGEESCRACLIRNDLSTMYDLAVPETMQLFNECSYLNVSIPEDPSDNVPQHICNMCYRLCELWQSFRTRCQETEKKLRLESPGSSKGLRRLEEVVVKQEPLEDSWIEEDSELVPEQNPEPDRQKQRSLVRKRRRRTQQGEFVDPTPKKRKRTPMPKVDPDAMEWGPGPNELGVWKHFHRDSTRDYAICLVPGCRTVVYCVDGSTGRMRYHARKIHEIVIPHKKHDTGERGEPKEPDAMDSTDFEWAEREDDK